MKKFRHKILNCDECGFIIYISLKVRFPNRHVRSELVTYYCGKWNWDTLAWCLYLTKYAIYYYSKDQISLGVYFKVQASNIEQDNIVTICKLQLHTQIIFVILWKLLYFHYYNLFSITTKNRKEMPFMLNIISNKCVELWS